MKGEGHKLSLALVDDDEALLGAVQASLEHVGVSCEVFTRAEAALRRIETTASFDAVVTDVVLPGMGGLELAKEVKRLRPEMCVIVMTGFVDDFSYDNALAAGASDFIKKPFTVHELVMRVKHVKMQERMRVLSITDELTGLPNRRGFFAFAERQLKMANRSGQNIVLLFADLDHLKTINDTWGHQVGDEALIAAAEIFRQTFRESDIIARIGGDEFVVMLVDTPEKNFAPIRERLNQNIAASNVRRQGSFAISISVGIAVFDHEEPSTIDMLLKEADERMYQEKQKKYGGAERS